MKKLKFNLKLNSIKKQKAQINKINILNVNYNKKKFF